MAEEKLEAEKAAHLDTKFACKVMQVSTVLCSSVTCM